MPLNMGVSSLQRLKTQPWQGSSPTAAAGFNTYSRSREVHQKGGSLPRALATGYCLAGRGASEVTTLCWSF